MSRSPKCLFIRTSCLSLRRAVAVDLVVDPIQAVDFVPVQAGLGVASRCLHLCVVVGRLVGYYQGPTSAIILTYPTHRTNSGGTYSRGCAKPQIRQTTSW